MSLLVTEPIKDIKGKVILESGKDVLEWAKRAVLTSEYTKKKNKFKDMPQLMEDLQVPFELDPYKTLLENWTPNFREWVGEMWAPSVIFDELKLQRVRDPYAYQHIMVIAVVGARLLELWITAAPTVKKAFLAFLFHDIGKIRVSSQILEKAGDLDEAERKALYQHPIASFVLNAAYWGDVNHLCAEVGLQHHEDRLGKGYPQGIKTNSLILDILKSIDRFDALISERPFRYKKYSVREAFDILKKDADEGRMESEVLKALVALIRREDVSKRKKLKLGTIGRADLPKK